jgi:hypothetical protein
VIARSGRDRARREEIVISTARTVVGLRLALLGVVFGAFALFVWIMVPEKYAPWAVAFVVLAWLYLVRSLLHIFITGQALVLNDRGLLAHVGSVDFVAWSEIDNAHIVADGPGDWIELDVNDVEAVLSRLPVHRRAFLRWHIKQGGKPGVASSFGEGGSSLLLELIRARVGPGRGGAASPMDARPSLESPDAQSDSGLLTKPFGRMSATAVVIYAVGIAIALYVYRRRDWDWDMYLFGLVGLAAVVVSVGLLPIYTGEVQIRSSTFSRSAHPVIYWAYVAIAVSLGVAVFLLGIGLI